MNFVSPTSAVRAAISLRTAGDSGGLTELFVVNTDGKGIGLHHPVLGGNFPQGRGIPENSPDIVEKELGVIVGVKSHQIRPQHPRENPLPPFGRHHPEKFIGGKWNVEEKTDVGLGKAFPDHAGEKEKLIVVNPDQVPRPDNLFHDIHEPLIGLDVIPERRVLEHREGRK